MADSDNDDVERGTLRLVGAFEIRAMLGVRRQRTYQITSRNDFPEPVAELCNGKVWLADEVEDWIRLNRAHLDRSHLSGNAGATRRADTTMTGSIPERAMSLTGMVLHPGTALDLRVTRHHP